MFTKLNKSAVIFTVAEDGQSDRAFGLIEDAIKAYEEPNIGPEKVLLQVEVLRKKVQVKSEQEIL